jgi:hypothetical protein
LSAKCYVKRSCFLSSHKRVSSLWGLENLLSPAVLITFIQRKRDEMDSYEHCF